MTGSSAMISEAIHSANLGALARQFGFERADGLASIGIGAVLDSVLLVRALAFAPLSNVELAIVSKRLRSLSLRDYPSVTMISLSLSSLATLHDA